MSNIENILTLFTQEISDIDLSQIDLDDISFRLPHFNKETIIDICSKATEIFKNEDILINLKRSHVYTIGDLHGNLFDVLRIIKQLGLPSKEKNPTYIFLGDIVDRGEFSLETVFIIFILKLLYPQNVYVIRGNHEFDSTCSEGGFKDDVIKIYDLDTYNSFLEVFSYLPLAVLINNQVLCLHGGIGPNFHSLNQIKQINRPIVDYNDDILISLLWSDPEETIQEFKNSYRGIGYVFGCDVFHRFIQENHLNLIVRGHECVDKGYQYLFGERLITVFSASKYCGCAHNSAGVIQLVDGLNPISIEFDPIEYIERDMVTFYDA